MWGRDVPVSAATAATMAFLRDSVTGAVASPATTASSPEPRDPRGRREYEFSHRYGRRLGIRSDPGVVDDWTDAGRIARFVAASVAWDIFTRVTHRVGGAR